MTLYSFIINFIHPVKSISCPYEDKKQLQGSELKIIRFWIDVNRETITVPSSSVQDAIDTINNFISHQFASLHDWSHLAGYLNWILNVFPLTRPALTEMYWKMSDKKWAKGLIPLNCKVITDLSWFRDVLSIMVTGWIPLQILPFKQMQPYL